MKKIFLIILIMLSFNAMSQIIRPFVGAAGYIYSSFKNSLFVGVEGGAEFKINRFIKPEIEVSYFYGSLEDTSNYGSQGQLISTFSSYSSAINFNVCPKICIGNTDQNDRYIVILPKYSFSNVTAVGEFSSLNSNDVKTTTKETISDWQHSLGIGIGVNFNLSDNNTDSFCVNIYYQNVDMGKVLNELNHSDAEISTNNVLGAGFKYYFGSRVNPRQKKTKKPEPM
jgi:opacity protein-like surface antigen